MNRGWEESTDRSDRKIDLKFVYSLGDLNRSALKKGCLINLCIGEWHISKKDSLTTCLGPQDFYPPTFDILDKELCDEMDRISCLKVLKNFVSTQKGILEKVIISLHILRTKSY